MQKKYYLVLALILHLFSCGEENPLNPDEQNQRGKISGKVVNQFEKPIAGVSITTNKDGFSSNTIEDGTYTIPDIESDTYTLTFSCPEYFDTTMDTTIAIAKMAQIININMVMHKKTGTISGSVTDTAGAALTNVTVTLSPAVEGVGSEKSINTGTDAAFSIEKVDLGIYEVQCTHPSYTAVNTPLCTLSSDDYTDSVSVTMQYNGGGAIISGHVFTTEKMPAKGATVKANGTASGEGTVGTDGSFSITGLETGEYSIEVVSLEYSDTLLAQKVQTKLDSTTLLDTIYVRKELNIKTGTVTGVLKSGEGSVPTLTSWSVSLTNQDTTISVTGEASTDLANFTLSPIPEGSWKVIATDLKHSADSSKTITVVDGQTHTLDTITLVDNNTKFIQRSVLGQFQVHRDTVDTVIVEVKGMGIPQWIPVGCSYNKTFGTFSGVVNVPESGQAWHVRTKTFVKTSTGKLIKIGQSKDIEFTKSSGDVEVTDFTDPTNAIPTVEILSPNNALIDTDVQLICNEHDTFEGVVEKKEWIFTVDGTVEATRSGDTVTYRFMKEKTYTIELKITDDDSNVVSTSKTIRIDNPDAKIDGLLPDSVTIDDTLSFSVNVTDVNGVQKIIWDWDDGTQETITENTQFVKTYSYPDTGTYEISVLSIDEFDDSTLATAKITVTDKSPIIQLGSSPTLIYSGNTVVFPFSVLEDGEIIKYEYLLEGSNDYTGFQYNGNLEFVVPKHDAQAKAKLTIKIVDDDENITTKTISVGINCFSKTLGGDYSDAGLSILSNQNNESIVMGSLGTMMGNNISVAKLNAQGKTVWNVKFGDIGRNLGGEMIKTSDGGYMIVGTTRPSGAYNNCWIIKIDDDGNTLWTKTLGDTTDNGCNAISELSDGGFALIAYSKSSGTKKLWLIKVDNEGNKIWDKLFTGGHGYSIIETTKGDLVVTGSLDSDLLVIGFDSIGNEIWRQKYGGAESDVGYKVTETSNNTLLITGYTKSFGAGASDAWLLNIDADGNQLWDKTFGGTDNDESYSVIELSSGGYILAGRTTSSETSNAWIIKTDNRGDKLWEKVIDAELYWSANSIVETCDNGLLITGSTKSSFSNIYILKMDSNGNTVPM